MPEQALGVQPALVLAQEPEFLLEPRLGSGPGPHPCRDLEPGLAMKEERAQPERQRELESKREDSAAEVQP